MVRNRLKPSEEGDLRKLGVSKYLYRSYIPAVSDQSILSSVIIGKIIIFLGIIRKEKRKRIRKAVIFLLR